MNIDEFHRKLNSPETLPKLAYRRNHRIYELVCYVNCLIGPRFSDNREGAALFRGRILSYLGSYTPKPDDALYCAMAAEYVNLDQIGSA
jgi:hypothetical protein